MPGNYRPISIISIVKNISGGRLIGFMENNSQFTLGTSNIDAITLYVDIVVGNLENRQQTLGVLIDFFIFFI